MELTQDVKKQIVAYAKGFTKSDTIYFHQFANRPGHMLVIETRNILGFQRFLQWMEAEVERQDIEVIRTLPEEINSFTEFESRSIGFFNCTYEDFGVATEVNDGRISHMKKDYETGGDVRAI